MFSRQFHPDRSSSENRACFCSADSGIDEPFARTTEGLQGTALNEASESELRKLYQRQPASPNKESLAKAWRKNHVAGHGSARAVSIPKDVQVSPRCREATSEPDR